MSGWRAHLAALLLYAALSWLFLDHGINITTEMLGEGQDPTAMVWFLAWWPYAVIHHLDPFYTLMVWQPQGLNLSWTTSLPLLALLAAPVTLTAGPVVAFNLLAIAAPAVSAWAAYALCWRLTRQWGAALAGGMLYGFSSFEAGHAGLQLNLSFIPFLPLLLLLGLERLQKRIGFVAFAAGVALLLAAQFMVSAELCATEAMMGGLAGLLGVFFVPRWRIGLLRLVPEVLAAGAVAGLLLLPVLRAMFTTPHDMKLPLHWPVIFATDPLNLVIPTAATLAGGGALLPISMRFSGFLCEQAGYLGVPLLLLLVLFIRRQLREVARFYAVFLGIIIVLSLGPVLWLGGVETGVKLPWALVRHLPLVGAALPGRLMLYAALLSAVCTALFIAQSPTPAARGRALRLALVACLFLLPSPHGAVPVPVSRFFAPGEVERALGSQPRLLIMPPGITGPSAYWQVESHFDFRQTAGYLGYPPARIQADTPLMRLYFGMDSPGLAADLARYCVATGTDYVVASAGTPDFAMLALASLHWPAQKIDDMTVFTVKPSP